MWPESSREGHYFEIPSHWTRGQLLDVRRYSDGQFIITALGDAAESPAQMIFDSSYATNQFLGWWYAQTYSDYMR